MVRCPKSLLGGETTWSCGRERDHRGSHLSASALEQLLLKRAKLEEKTLVVKGEELGSIRRQLARVKRVLDG